MTTHGRTKYKTEITILRLHHQKSLGYEQTELHDSQICKGNMQKQKHGGV